MILSDRNIRLAMEEKELHINRPDGQELYIGPSSVDLHLNGKARKLMRDLPIHVQLDVKKDNSHLFETFEFERLVILPGDFFILASDEMMKFSNRIAGFIQGRSSLARIGLQIHAAGYFDPGFQGTATLEVTNMTQVPIVIYSGMRIAQMVFMRTQTPVEVSYVEKNDSKYFGQNDPTLSQIHKDF